MRKKILITLAVIAGILLILVGVIAMQPATYSIARSTTIQAPPGQVFTQVNDFHNWEAWSPWAKLDPNSKATFEGPSSGIGAIFKWSGNDDVGEGQMTITDSQPNQAILIKLDFVRPFPDTCDVRFDFKPQADGTQVTWTMSGHKGFIQKAVCMFMDMEKMIGPDFDRGLASLKKASELSSSALNDAPVATNPSVPQTAPAATPKP